MPLRTSRLTRQDLPRPAARACRPRAQRRTMEPCSSVKNTALRIKERIKRLCVRNKQNENEFSCYMPSHFIDKRNMKMVKIRKDRFQSNILIRATLDNFSEEGYLAANIDVQQAVTNHVIKSGYDHFINHGKKENRLQYIRYDLKSGNELEIQKMYFENVHLQIDTNSACNLMCRTCPRGVRVMKNERKFMDYSLFKSIIDKAKINNIRSLEMHNWTEPFLHPQLTEFAAYAKAKDFSVCISSNLALPNISHLAAILQEIDTLYVSVSGFTQATYSINHKCGKIDNVKNNLEKIIQIMEKTSFGTRPGSVGGLGWRRSWQGYRLGPARVRGTAWVAWVPAKGRGVCAGWPAVAVEVLVVAEAFVYAVHFCAP